MKPPTNIHGRVNYVTTEEAQEYPNVVLGMILANSTPSCELLILVHLTLSSQFFSEHINMHFESMNASMIIQAPGSSCTPIKFVRMFV
jgi:hypothetical protein